MTREITEKDRRIYYQDIVYAVCNIIDRNLGGTIACGTIENPTRAVQEVLSECRIRRISDDDGKWIEAAAVDDLGLWWYCNGEQVFAVEIGASRANDGRYEYFAYLGQHGWTRAQNVTEMGGKWQKARVPEVPE